MAAARVRVVLTALFLVASAMPSGLVVAQPSSIPGDCNADGSVTIDELLKGVNIALGNLPIDTCAVFDQNHDAEVTVDELIAAINAALLQPLPTPHNTVIRTATATDRPTPTRRPTASPTPTSNPCVATTPSSAISLSVPVSTSGGSKLDGASCGWGGGANAPEAVLEYSAPAQGVYDFTVRDATFDPLLYVRAQSCTGPELRCAYDNTTKRNPTIELPLDQDEHVWIVVDGSGEGETGSATLDIALRQPDLEVSELIAPSDATFGQAFQASAMIKNKGRGDSGPFEVEFVFARDPKLSQLVALPSLACKFSLAAGATAKCEPLNPIDVPALAPGNYYFGAVVDRTNHVAESDETNNTLQTTMTIKVLGIEFKQDAFIADDGSFYQVLRAIPSAHPNDANGYSITSLIGTIGPIQTAVDSGEGEGTTAIAQIQTSSSPLLFDIEQVLHTQIFDANGATFMEFDPDANGGRGVICLTSNNSDTATACASGTKVTRDGGAGFASVCALTAGCGNIPPAGVAHLSLGTFNGAAYAFGSPPPDPPTTYTQICAPSPADGLYLPVGYAVIFVYNLGGLISFTVGAAGFGIDVYPPNHMQCLSGGVVGVIEETTKIPARADTPTPTPTITPTQGCALPGNATCTPVPSPIVTPPSPTPTPTTTPTTIPTSAPGPPAALPSSANVSTSGTTVGSTNGGYNASCGEGGTSAPDVSFSYVASATGPYQIDTIGSQFDTILYVRDSMGSELACDDDSGGNQTSRVIISLQTGQSVVIFVDGFAAAQGLFTLNITLLPLNLIQNGSFEDGTYSPTGSPSGWQPSAFEQGATFTWDDTVARDGTKSVKIDLTTFNDAGWTQTVPVDPGTLYNLSGWIKTENVAHTNGDPGADIGANLSLCLPIYGCFIHSPGLLGTNDWSYVTVEFNSLSNTQVTVAARLGTYNGEAIGTAWFDQLYLERLGPPNTVAPMPSPILTASPTVALTSTPADVQTPTPMPATPAGGQVLALAIDPVTPTTIYAGGSGGVSKSTDAGANWTASNTGLTGTFVRALAIDPVKPTTLYAGGFGGVFKSIFKSADGGGNWTASNTGLIGRVVQALAIDPKTPATLYAGTIGGGGAFRSSDGGGTWTSTNIGLTDTTIEALAIDPLTPTTLYAGTLNGGVFKSTDAGANWTASNTGLTSQSVDTLAIDPVTPTTIYAGGPGGIFKSTDAGANWAASSTGLTSQSVDTLAIDPVTPTTFYAGGSGGIFKSTDAGGNWAANSTGLPNTGVQALAIDPLTPTTLYAGTLNGGIFKSTNGGATWTVMSSGLAAQADALAIDPMNPTGLYAGTTGGGVFILEPAPME